MQRRSEGASPGVGADQGQRRQQILAEISNLFAQDPAQVYLVDTSIPLAMNPNLSNWEYQALIHANIAAYQIRKR
jgi:hypothetical protein